VAQGIRVPRSRERPGGLNYVLVSSTRRKLLAPGELVHVDADLRIDRRIAFPEPPKQQLRHDDLTGRAAASQHSSVA
jgi:hypothetical protein